MGRPRSSRGAPVSTVASTDSGTTRAVVSQSVSQRRSILIVDDDRMGRYGLERVLQGAGYDAEGVATTQAAMSATSRRRFDLWLVDWRLDADGTRGTDLVRRLRQSDATTPFILYSGFLTTPVTVEAMKLGACNVLERMTELSEFVRAIAEALDPAASGPEHRPPAAQLIARRLQPAVATLADWIVRALAFDGDFKTLAGLAKCVATSERRFRAHCAVAGIDSLEARDFARSLSAVVWSVREGCTPESLFQGDPQTLRTLCARAGLPKQRGETITVEQFFERQEFIPVGHELLRAVRERLAKKTAT